MQITALAGGVGAPKLLLGFSRVMDARSLTVVVNTGDDIVLVGNEPEPPYSRMAIPYMLIGRIDRMQQLLGPECRGQGDDRRFGVLERGGQADGLALRIDLFGDLKALFPRMAEQLLHHFDDIVIRMVVVVPQDDVVTRLPAGRPRSDSRF